MFPHAGKEHCLRVRTLSRMWERVAQERHMEAQPAQARQTNLMDEMGIDKRQT